MFSKVWGSEILVTLDNKCPSDEKIPLKRPNSFLDGYIAEVSKGALLMQGFFFHNTFAYIEKL